MPLDARRCPECGRLIRYGTPVGRREANRRMVRTGQVLLIPGLFGLALVVTTLVRQINWVQREPLWLVIRSIRTVPLSDRGAHLDELERRIGAGSLSAGELENVAQILLETQTDDRRPWSPRIGDLIEQLNRLGNLSAEQWQGYVTNNNGVTVLVRPQIRVGDPVAAMLWVNDLRSSQSAADTTIRLDELSIDDQPQAEMFMEDIVDPPRSTRTRGVKVVSDVDLSAGLHELTLHYRLKFAAWSGTTPVTKDETQRIKFAVVGDAESIEAWQPQELERRDFMQPVVRRTDSGGISIRVVMSRLPVSVGGRRLAVAYDVFVRAGEREWPAGGYCVSNQDTPLSPPLLSCPQVPPTVNEVDLVFRPSRRRALRDVSNDMWLDKEFVISRVGIGPR
jgi:hypothetical protein